MQLGINYALVTGPAERMLKGIHDESVDFVMTSPPYDSVRAYEGHTFNQGTFRKIARELYRVLKPGGTVAWVVADQTKNGSESGTSFEQALYFKKNVGFWLWDTMIYQRSNPPLTHRRYEQGFEYVFILTKGTPATFNGIREEKLYPESKPRRKAFHREVDGSHKIGTYKAEATTKLKSNVWHYGKAITTDKLAFQHPAIYPEKLARDHIYSWSKSGDVVLDPFCGSGTTAKVALQMNRKFIGIEISPEYVSLTQERLRSIEEAI